MPRLQQGRPCHPDIVTDSHKMEKVVQGDEWCLYCLGPPEGVGDSSDSVSPLSAYLPDIPIHETTLQERARARPIFHSSPCAQVGTIDSDHHQHRA